MPSLRAFSRLCAHPGPGERRPASAVRKDLTIKENRAFRRIYNRGRSAVTPFLVLYCRPNRLDHNRLGVTVSTKLGCAVVRNRARRRLREVYRLAQPDLRQGYDIILVARSRTVDAPYDRLTRAFSRACGELKLLEKRPET